MDTVKTYLINEYNKLAFTHSYIFGYACGGVVYSARVMDARSLLPFLTYVDRASSKNGRTHSLKYRPNSKQWTMVCAQAEEIKTICTVEYLENMRANTRKNKGQLFEELVARAYNGELETKSNLKFNNGGDMVLNGVAYQIKYIKATFTDERTLMNLKQNY